MADSSPKAEVAYDGLSYGLKLEIDGKAKIYPTEWLAPDKIFADHKEAIYGSAKFPFPQILVHLRRKCDKVNPEDPKPPCLTPDEHGVLWSWKWDAGGFATCSSLQAPKSGHDIIAALVTADPTQGLIDAIRKNAGLLTKLRGDANDKGTIRIEKDEDAKRFYIVAKPWEAPKFEPVLGELLEYIDPPISAKALIDGVKTEVVDSLKKLCTPEQRKMFSRYELAGTELKSESSGYFDCKIAVPRSAKDGKPGVVGPIERCTFKNGFLMRRFDKTLKGLSDQVDLFEVEVPNKVTWSTEKFGRRFAALKPDRVATYSAALRSAVARFSKDTVDSIAADDKFRETLLEGLRKAELSPEEAEAISKYAVWIGSSSRSMDAAILDALAKEVASLREKGTHEFENHVTSAAFRFATGHQDFDLHLSPVAEAVHAWAEKLPEHVKGDPARFVVKVEGYASPAGDTAGFNNQALALARADRAAAALRSHLEGAKFEVSAPDKIERPEVGTFGSVPVLSLENAAAAVKSGEANDPEQRVAMVRVIEEVKYDEKGTLLSDHIYSESGVPVFYLDVIAVSCAPLKSGGQDRGALVFLYPGDKIFLG